jgi:pyruvate-ferredoxin/flavodoxin oxidoreductase
MTGLRAANFSSGQGVAFMHESLYAAVGKRLTYVLNMGCRAMTKASLNVHAATTTTTASTTPASSRCSPRTPRRRPTSTSSPHRIAELSLTPASWPGRLPHHPPDRVLRLPERELIAEYLGKPGRHHRHADAGPGHASTAPKRRRIPELWDVDNAADLRLGAEPGRLHAERGRPAAVLLRPHRRAHRPGCMASTPSSPAAATSASSGPTAARTPTT